MPLGKENFVNFNSLSNTYKTNDFTEPNYDDNEKTDVETDPKIEQNNECIRNYP